MASSIHRHSLDLIQSTIIISEDDVPSSSAGEQPQNKFVIRRCISVPETLWDIRSVMKIRTLDESVHSTYGGSDNGNRGNIKFHTVKIREYARTVGDNPSCSSGPPVSISWEYKSIGEVELDEYEEQRPPRRSHFEMVLPRKIRQNMLRHEWDIKQKEIAESVRRNIKIKNQRKATVSNLGKASKVEEIFESVGRKFKRIVTFQPPISKQVKKLEEKANAAQRRRSQLALEKFMSGEYEDRSRPFPRHHDGANETDSTMDVGDASTRSSGP